MRKIIYFCFPLLLSLCAVSQNYTLEISIPDYVKSELTFCSQFGDKSKILETIVTNDDGTAIHNMTDYEIGVYRIYFENEQYFDIIFNNENVRLSLLAAAPVETMQVIESSENKILYSFMQQSYALSKKIDVLNHFLTKYPKGKLYKKVQKEFDAVSQEQLNLSKSLTSVNRQSFAARMIAYYTNPIIPKEIKEAGQENNYIRDNFFSFYPCNDTLLINSPVYSGLALNYLRMFSVAGNYEASVEGFKKAAINLLNQTAPNEKIQTHILKILIDGFESLQLFTVADFLLETYGAKCISDDNMSTRYRNITELRVGTDAPILIMKDEQGVPYPFEYKNRTIVVFWATWCDHCRQVIPQLDDYFRKNKRPDIDVILVSLDTEKGDLHEFLALNGISLPVSCDFKSWGGINAISFSVYATPFYFIIDKNGKIESKPYDFEALMKVL